MLKDPPRYWTALACVGLIACGDPGPGESSDVGETTPPIYDCAALPAPQIRQLDGPIASADVGLSASATLTTPRARAACATAASTI